MTTQGIVSYDAANPFFQALSSARENQIIVNN